MKGLRELFDKMGTAQRPEQQDSLRWLGPLRHPLDRYLSGGKVDDPFYLSNQTTGQRVRRGILVSLPFVLALVVVLFAHFRPRMTKPVAEPTRAEMARTLPDFTQTVKVPSQDELQVTEAVVRHKPGTVLAGRVRNMTDREIPSAEISFELADLDGTQVGAVTTVLTKLKPQAERAFQFPIKQTNASVALVREVIVH